VTPLKDKLGKKRCSLTEVYTELSRGERHPQAAPGRGGSPAAQPGASRALGGEPGNPGRGQRELTVVLLHRDVRNGI